MNTLFQTHEPHPFYVQALNEHARLHEAVEQLRQTLKTCAGEKPCEATLCDMRARLQDLRADLAQHFQQEEAGGYLEEAVTRVPQLTPQAQQLQRQHAEFLGLADTMIDDINCVETRPGAWTKLFDDFDLFAKKLLAHEQAENVLLGRAFNEDVT